MPRCYRSEPAPPVVHAAKGAGTTRIRPHEPSGILLGMHATAPTGASLPDPLPLVPSGPVEVRLAVPGSKSLTNRALAIAALAEGSSTLRGALVAEDREVMARGLRDLGFEVEGEGDTVVVHGCGGRIPAEGADLDLRLSGTAIRFLAAMCALGQGTYRLDGNARMRERPIQDQIEALRSLGTEATWEGRAGYPPVRIHGAGLRGGSARVAGARSSQFLSALLMVAPAAQGGVVLEVEGELLSRPFVDMTVALMEVFGVHVAREEYRRFAVAPARYRAGTYQVEGDAMSAGYFFAAAAVTGGRACITNVAEDGVQGDLRLVQVLTSMGCHASSGPEGLTVTGPAGGHLRGGRFDLNDMPDQAQTLAVCGLFADRPVQIRNVANLRIKETDRLAALARELTRLGARVEEEPDAITVHPLDDAWRRRDVVTRTYGDHRMAMAFAVAGLRLPGIALEEPGCVAKTYPGFFRDWAATGGVAARL